MTIIYWLAGIFVGTVAVQWGRRFLLNRYFNKIGREDQSRILALRRIAQNASKWLIWIVSFVMALDTIGLNIGALVAALGVMGLAVSFGAQSFIKDIISYIVFVFADKARLGEDVVMDGKRGLVAEIGPGGVDLISRKDGVDSTIFVPYSKIGTVENFSRVSNDE